MRSPHAFFYVDATDENGVVQNWEVELASVVHLRRMGIDQSTFEPGDTITVAAWPNRVPGRSLVYGISYITEDGDVFGEHPDLAANSNSDVDSDSLQGIAAVTGRWSSPIPTFNRQEALPLNEAGSLAAASYDPQLSPATTCEPTTIPDLQLAPYLTDIQIEADEVIFRHEVYGITRTIPLNAPAAQVEPTGYMGMASARIDGDELVIESSGYPVSRWGLSSAAQSKGGPFDVPSSAQKKVVERYSVSENGQVLTLTYSLDDPAYLTEVYTGQINMNRAADDVVMYPYECEVDSAKRFSE